MGEKKLFVNVFYFFYKSFTYHMNFK